MPSAGIKTRCWDKVQMCVANTSISWKGQEWKGHWWWSRYWELASYQQGSCRSSAEEADRCWVCTNIASLFTLTVNTCGTTADSLVRHHCGPRIFAVTKEVWHNDMCERYILHIWNVYIDLSKLHMIRFHYELNAKHFQNYY